MEVKKLKWVRNGAAIDMVLQHPTFGEITFTATPDDPEEYGRKLYEAAKNGDFGLVAAENE